MRKGLQENFPRYTLFVLDKIIERRNACLNETKDIVDICVNLSSILFPIIVCLIRSELLILQPWPGDGNGIQGYSHCKTRIDRNTSGLWQANLDMDELIVLKNTKCLNTFLSQYKAPAVHIRWAMFVPQLPLQDYHFTSIAPDSSLIIPHEMFNTRKKLSGGYKAASRTECVLSFPNPHTIRVKDNCKYGGEKSMVSIEDYSICRRCIVELDQNDQEPMYNIIETQRCFSLILTM